MRVVALLLALGLWQVPTGTLLPVQYPLIAQRPDENGAVHAPYESDFRLCCSAASASMVRLPSGPRVLPVESVQASILLTARLPEDAVRIRIYSYNDAAQVVEQVWSAPLVPSALFAARPVSVDLTDEWRARTCPVTFWGVEVRGAPVLFGATLRVVYDLGAFPR